MEVLSQNNAEPMDLSVDTRDVVSLKAQDAHTERAFGRDLTNVQSSPHNRQTKRPNKRTISSLDDGQYSESEPIKRRRLEAPVEKDEVKPELKETEECPPLRYLAPCDKSDKRSELACVEYIEEIFRNLRAKEEEIGEYMRKQTDINGRMRTILLDWMIEVHHKFKLSAQTFHLCVRLLDRFLAVRDVKRTDLQLVGSTCLWVASKYHEIYAPEICDFTFVADEAFDQRQMLTMEVQLVSALKFDLCCVCPLTFLMRFMKIFTSAMKQQHKRMTRCLMMLFLEEALLNYETALEKPSRLAAAVVAITLKFTVKNFTWSKHFVQYTGYNMSELESIVAKLDANHQKMCKKGSKHMRALRKKFSSKKFARVSTFQLKRDALDE